jgi:outer membrane immunogenic protein
LGRQSALNADNAELIHINSYDVTRFVMNKTAAAVLAIAFSIGAASAADLPSIKGPPVYVPPPIFSWTGFYAGVNLGYGFGNNDPDYGAHTFFFTPPLPAAPVGAVWVGRPLLSGVIGGGQVGYNYQFNPWLVVGLETDIQGADLRSSSFSFTSADPPPPAAHFGTVLAKQSVDWFGTVRGRIGFTPFNPRLLIYGTGGFAYGGVNHLFQYADNFPPFGSLFGGASYSNTKTGWTAGGGVEYAPLEFPNWSLKAEYLYVDLGRTYLSAAGAGIFQLGPVTTVNPPVPGFFVAAHDPATRFHVVRVGLNYHFNLFGGGAIVAAY